MKTAIKTLGFIGLTILLVFVLTKNKEISEDDERRFHDLIQKDTDFYISEIDKLIDLKEKDLLTI